MSHKYNRAKALKRSELGRKMAKARWDKREKELKENPPPISDANRVFDHLQARRGTIAEIHDIAIPAKKEVTTWVFRHSIHGRCDQFDLFRNGTFIITGGRKSCSKAMTPKFHPILHYD